MENKGRSLRAAEIGEQLVADHRMPLDQLALIGVERARLAKHAVGQDDLADVMEKCSDVELLELLARDADDAGKRARQLGDCLRMVAVHTRPAVEHVGELGRGQDSALARGCIRHRVDEGDDPLRGQKTAVGECPVGTNRSGRPCGSDRSARHRGDEGHRRIPGVVQRDTGAASVLAAIEREVGALLQHVKLVRTSA